MTPRTLRFGLLGLPALLLVAAGCGSGSPATGTMRVHLLTAPVDSLQRVDLHILALEAHSNTTGWKTLSEPKATFDLLSIDGVVETLASGIALEPGKYTQFRLVLGPGQQDAAGAKISNLVVLDDGTTHDLTVPSGLQSGVKLVCQVDVQPGANTDVFISFEMPQSIHVHGTGSSATYILRPVIHCFQGPGVPTEPPPAETGSITGELNFLNASESQEPLVGVTVTAQVLDTAGKASIVGSTTTDATGFYTLDNLPLGATYYVVTQPVMVVAGTPPAPSQTFSWEARASQGLLLDAANPTRSFTDFLPSPVPTGSVAGTIAPPTNLNNLVLVRQVVHPLSDQIAFIVRAEVVSADGIHFSFADLPLGSYTAEVFGSALGVSGPSMPVVLDTASATVPVALTPP